MDEKQTTRQTTQRPTRTTLTTQWLDHIGETNATERARVTSIAKTNPDVQAMLLKWQANQQATAKWWAA